MRKFYNKIIRLLHRINSVISVFKNNNGKIRPILNLSGFNSNRTYVYPNFKKNRQFYLKDFHRYYSYIINDKNQYIFTKLTSYFVFQIN